MAKRNLYLLFAACSVLALASCGGNGEKSNKGAIVLGDSSSIVTETDTRYTKDLVADLHPNIPTKTHHDDEETKAPADTSQAKADAGQQTAKAQPIPGNGLTIAFKEVSVSIPDIAVKTYRNQDPMKSNGVSYQLVGGNIINSRLIINSGAVLKVSQRYQSQIVVNGDDADLTLDNLNTTTDWVSVTGNKNVYPIKGLEAAKLQAPEFTASSLRSAITRAARRHRMSRKTEQEYQASVHNVRRANQRPLSVSLRSVMWKIDGKDASGKAFSKQVRVDIQ